MAQVYKSECYCTNLRRSTNIVSSFYDSFLKESGLTIAQYYLLINLSRLGSANITHWAERVGLDRSTLVRNIKLLQAHDYIQAVAGHGKVFTLSPWGEQALASAKPLWQKAQEQIEVVLGNDDIDALLRISDKLQSLNKIGEK